MMPSNPMVPALCLGHLTLSPEGHSAILTPLGGPHRTQEIARVRELVQAPATLLTQAWASVSSPEHEDNTPCPLQALGMRMARAVGETARDHSPWGMLRQERAVSPGGCQRREV